MTWITWAAQPVAYDSCMTATSHASPVAGVHHSPLDRALIAVDDALRTVWGTHVAGRPCPRPALEGEPLSEADRREGLARLTGQVETGRARVESIDDGVARLTAAIDEAAARTQQARAEFETVQSRIDELDQGEVGLDEHHDRTVASMRVADERVAELQTAERAAERLVASLQARIDALAVGLERRDGAAWLVENRSGVS